MTIFNKKIKQVVIGIGLNINQNNFDDLNATSILKETGYESDIKYVRNLLNTAIEKRYLDINKNIEELKQDEMNEKIFQLDNIIKAANELNIQNNLLKNKYSNDSKFVKIHKRLFDELAIFGTKIDVSRGFHAHYKLKQVAICIAGSCRFILDNGKKKEEVLLENPNQGLIVNNMIWHEMYDFSYDCILMVLANDYYEESDYIRDYNVFLKNI